MITGDVKSYLVWYDHFRDKMTYAEYLRSKTKSTLQSVLQASIEAESTSADTFNPSRDKELNNALLAPSFTEGSYADDWYW